MKNTLPQEAHIAIIKDLWERRTDTKFNEDFHYEVARCCHEGIISQASLMETQNLYGGGELLRISCYLRVNEKTGMSENEAIELGHKVEFIKLCKVEDEGGYVIKAFHETVKAGNEIIDAIFNDTYGREKIDLLKSLPEIKTWKKENGVALSIKHYSKFYND